MVIVFIVRSSYYFNNLTLNSFYWTFNHQSICFISIICVALCINFWRFVFLSFVWHWAIGPSLYFSLFMHMIFSSSESIPNNQSLCHFLPFWCTQKIPVTGMFEMKLGSFDYITPIWRKSYCSKKWKEKKNESPITLVRHLVA